MDAIKFTPHFACLLVVFQLTDVCLCEAAHPTDLLEELVAVRSENFGRLISWRGVVEHRKKAGHRNVHEIEGRRTEFLVDVPRAYCRSIASPIIDERASPSLEAVNFIAIMRTDGEYCMLRSFTRVTNKGLLLEYRPAEVFATLTDIPGSGDYFDPLQNWDYNSPDEDVPSRLLSAVRDGVDVLSRGSIRLEGSSVVLEGGDGNRCIFELDRGGLMSSLQSGEPLNQTWTASHVNVGGIWLPSVVRSEIDTSGVSQLTETVWKDHEVNVPTEGEFTLAAMGAYNGLRLLDHVRNSQRTLVGPDYLPQPSNLWGAVNRPDEGGHWRRWTLWINAAVVVVAAVAILLRLAMRSRFAH
jgi:hypothetical protein